MTSSMAGRDLTHTQSNSETRTLRGGSLEPLSIFSEIDPESTYRRSIMLIDKERSSLHKTFDKERSPPNGTDRRARTNALRDSALTTFIIRPCPKRQGSKGCGP